MNNNKARNLKFLNFKTTVVHQTDTTVFPSVNNSVTKIKKPNKKTLAFHNGNI